MNTRRFAAAALLAAAGAVATAGLSTAAPAHADVDQFVAIAYSPATGSWGWGNQYDSYDGATTRAIQECQSHGGTDCQLASWSKNDCAALAVKDSNSNWYGWYGPNRFVAESLALVKNHGGHIVESRCATS